MFHTAKDLGIETLTLITTYGNISKNLSEYVAHLYFSMKL